MSTHFSQRFSHIVILHAELCGKNLCHTEQNRLIMWVHKLLPKAVYDENLHIINKITDEQVNSAHNSITAFNSSSSLSAQACSTSSIILMLCGVSLVNSDIIAHRGPVFKEIQAAEKTFIDAASLSYAACG